MASAGVWVVIAAFNEVSAIGKVIEGLLPAGYTIVVVDDCSSDGTAGEARRFPVHLIRHPVNLGQGAALQTGISYALARGAEYIVTFDADGQHRPESLPQLLEPVRSGEVDVAIGTRFAGGGAAENMPPAKLAMLKLAIIYSRLTTGLELTDTHNGLRAFSRAAAAKILITQNRMAHATQILAQIAEHRLRFKEVPVRIVYTAYSMKKGQRLSNAINIIWDSIMGWLEG